jgi:hypothetical protein
MDEIKFQFRYSNFQQQVLEFGFSDLNFLGFLSDFNERLKKRKSSFRLLFLFVTVSSRSFFTFVRRYLMSFSFFTTWHSW